MHLILNKHTKQTVHNDILLTALFSVSAELRKQYHKLYKMPMPMH